jgi:UDP-glucose 4-epimerase
MTEATTPAPEDPYGVAKYACEMDLRAAHEMFGLNHTIFRPHPHNVYGEHQNIGDRYRNVIGIFMNQIMQGEPMTIFGDGLQTRAFTHVDDVAPVIARCVDVPGSSNRIFNIGAEVPTSVRDLACVVAKVLGTAPQIRYLDARKEVVHAFSSSAALTEVFGPQSHIPLEEGVARMAAWARAKGPRLTAPFAGIEVLKNLPPAWKAAFVER